MIKLTISFISGIAAFTFSPFFPFSISALFISIIVFLLIKHRENRKKIFLIVSIFIFGVFYGFVRHETLPEMKFPDTEVLVEGRVADVPEMSEGRLRFTLDSVEVEGEAIQGKVRLVIYQEYFGEDISDKLSPGDRISAAAKLREPGTFRNPGVYSYDLKRDGIAVAGYVKRLNAIGRSSGPVSWIHQKRQELGRTMDSGLSAESAAFHKAIVPGLKKGISREMRDAFSATGLAHLLSISGTHFGLLAFIVFNLVRLFFTYLPVRVLTRMTMHITPSQAAVLLTLPVLVLYLLLSGSSTPAVRSMIMVVIYMGALFLGRRGQWLNSLSIAAFIILLWHPGALFELSFQLSFLAVLFIGLVLEKRQDIENEDPEYKLPASQADPSVSAAARGRIFILDKIKTTMFITIAAVLGTAPIVALVFKQFPLISPVTNLIITPLVCFIILPLGFFTGFSALMFNMSSMPLSGLTDAATHFVLRLVNVFSLVPYASFHVHGPSVALTVFYYASLLLVLKGRVKWRLVPFVLICCFYLVSPYLSDDNLKVTFLDVGQAEASLVELPGGKTMLIDGGTYEPDTGRMAVAPYLWSRGIRDIDYLVLSHPHPDHYGGLFYMVENFKIGEVWINKRTVYGAGGFFKKIKEKGIPYRVLTRGDALEADRYRIYVLHPYDRFNADSPRGEFSNINSGSLVLKVESDNGSVLFTGDVEEESENTMIQLGRWLESDIIKVPHHGGRSSSSDAFIAAVRPEAAVISVGRNNSYGHPHRDTLKRYRNAGVKVYRTDLNGAVTVEFKANSYGIKTYDDYTFKKVLGLQDEIRNVGLLF